ncbi:MAG: hypothetical protein PHP08_04600 [Candidatus Dojkabacteria bacterium]|nr:hypothetical protein [Candidatus Dojkabacteria bacterium]
MKDLIDKLKPEVEKLSHDENFIHHKWFFKYHLELVERISLELYEKYKDSDLDLIKGLIWIHDYGKIIGLKDDKEVLERSRNFLYEIGFEDSYVNRVIELLNIFESKMTMDLSEAPMEVRIVSTADGVSHMFGPFYQIYWYENPEMSVEELMESNMGKLKKDWDRKIVLPEVKESLQEQYDFLRQSFGKISKKIFNY